MQAIRVQQTAEKDGELLITNIPVVEGQQVEVLLLFTSAAPQRPRMTARQLLDSGLIGLWQARDDIADSAAYARQLREQAQQRYQADEPGDDHS